MDSKEKMDENEHIYFANVDPLAWEFYYED